MPTVQGTDQDVPLPSNAELLPPTSFKAVIWASFSLCFLVFGTRAYIRIVCLGRLVAADYLMIVGLAFLLTTSVVTQLWIEYAHNMMTVASGVQAPSPTFINDTLEALRGMMIQTVLSILTIWLVKFNFLLFFYRLGHNLPRYKVCWWIVAIFTAGCGGLVLAAIKYECFIGDTETIFGYCHTPEATKTEWNSLYNGSIISASLDALTDVLILAFPCTILWNVRISLRKKLILLALFSITLFTIAVAILRGSIFGGTFELTDDEDMKSLNITWIWFWLSMEAKVSFIVACLVSFRTLFVHKSAGSSSTGARQRRYQSSNSSKPSWLRGRAVVLHDTLLDTFMSMEGVESFPQVSELPHPPSGRLSLDFLRENAWVELSTNSDPTKSGNIPDHR